MYAILHRAYRLSPDSKAARGKAGPAERAEEVSDGGPTLVELTRGVHW
jgi:hypothetical protein